MDWEEVVRRRGSRSAIRIVDGKVTSILCGGADHANEIFEDRVKYVIPRRPFYEKSIEAMKMCRDANNLFTVFNKVEKNQWEELGKFYVQSLEIGVVEVVVNLVKVVPD